MSRHKLVKNLDLEDELDDYDGGGYDEEEGGEELGEEDREQMRRGTIAVREALPPSASHVTDEQIQEALWHYYYDGPKSVAYLVSTYGVGIKEKKEGKGKKKKGGFCSFTSGNVEMSSGQEVGAAEYFGDSSMEAVPECSRPFSFAEFFKDTPWLNIPTHREAVLIAPLFPRGGLLGGSSDGAPKMSKLQALAAARKKKAQEQKSGGSAAGVEQPMWLKLDEGSTSRSTASSSENAVESISAQKHRTRAFPLRKRKDSNPHEKPPKAPGMQREPEAPISEAVMEPPLNQAEPSAFANTMFGSSQNITVRQHSDNLFSLPYVSATTIATADPFAGPSPDDVVIAAQSKASGKGGKGPPKTTGEKKADQISNSVEALRMNDAPRVTSKNLDVLAEFEKANKKNAANFVVIGHVDAGKSTLMGRLLHDLNVVDQRTIDRYQKEAEKMGKASFAYAWVLDSGKEERARGVTIDIATYPFETEKTLFTLVDAPGHRDFVPNMIAGAFQADFAVLVIDADTGSFESGLKGQTREHVFLARSVGIQRIIVAVNKLDMVAWDQERFTEIEQQVSGFLKETKFLAQNISFIPCSGLLGENVARPISDPNASWYTGPTLVQELENFEPTPRALKEPLRLQVADIFQSGTQNPLSISSRIEAGSLQNGDALLIQPSGQKCFVKSIELDDNVVDWAVAGQNVTINLSGIEEDALSIGSVLSSPRDPIKNVKQFTAIALAFDVLLPMPVDVHRGRLHVPGTIKEFKALLDIRTGAVISKKKVRLVKANQVARVVIELEEEAALEKGMRLVLRHRGDTVAALLLE